MYKQISWIVVHGEKLWRKLGFPTANMVCNRNDISDSVFHINIIIDGKIYRWMGSYMVKKWVFEAHIFNFDADIYGENIEVILLKKIRDNKKFTSLEELISQINTDKKTIMWETLNILTFGSFDVTHQWHKYYLQEALKYGNHLITIVASDNNIEKIKWRKAQHDISERIDFVKNLWVGCEVIAGSDNNPMQWLEKFTPATICLGYDQRWPFVERLESKLTELWLETKIIRIEPHHPEKFKSSILKNKKNNS